MWLWVVVAFILGVGLGLAIADLDAWRDARRRRRGGPWVTLRGNAVLRGDASCDVVETLAEAVGPRDGPLARVVPYNPHLHLGPDGQYVTRRPPPVSLPPNSREMESEHE